MSKGRDLITIPNFIGKNIQEATALATEAGVELETKGSFTKNRRGSSPGADGRPRQGAARHRRDDLLLIHVPPIAFTGLTSLQ